MICPELVDNTQVVVTNAKGIFSSSLGMSFIVRLPVP